MTIHSKEVMSSRGAVVGVARNVFLLYLVISGGFLAPLFGCPTQQLLRENHNVRHILGFFTLYVVIVLASGDNESAGLNRYTRLPLTMAVYALFVLSTRTDLRWWGVFMSLLLLMYGLDIVQKEMGSKSDDNVDGLSDESRDIILTTQTTLAVLSMAVLVAGVYLYVRQQRQAKAGEFVWSRFVIGESNCPDVAAA